MKVKTWLKLVALCGLLLAVVGSARAQAPSPQTALGASFTYQGYLTDGGQPADGVYDLRFILYDADVGGSQVGSTLVRDDVPVAGGVFVVLLDFGTGSFDGDARHLETAVRAGSSTGSYTVLSPRQALTATPYALYALDADNLDGYDATDLASTAAYAGGNQTVSLGPADEVIRYVIVTAPKPGWIIVNASLYVYRPADGDFARCSITTGTALDANALTIASNAGYASLAATRGYTVGAGTYRFNLVCDSNSDQVTARDSNITAIFVPGVIAASSTLATSPAAISPSEGCVDGYGIECGP